MQSTLDMLTTRLLLIGFFFTPFTSLRLGPIGPGEVLILASGFFAILGSQGGLYLDRRIKVVTNFWIPFLAVTICGFFYNSLFLGLASGHLSSIIFDLFSYIFVLLSILLAGHVSRLEGADAGKFFRKLFASWAIAYSVLYLISFLTPSIFGLTLVYDERSFTPLVENVHQASSLTCAMPFVMIFMATQTKIRIEKVIYVVSAVLFVFMALASGSTKALMGIVAGTLVSIITLLFLKQSGKHRILINFISITLLLFSIIVFITIFFNLITSTGFAFFQENDTGGGRQTLYWSAFQHGLESFIIGYGPGSHTPFRQDFWDAHNTLLTIFLQSGILGIFILIYFGVRLFGRLKNHYAIIGAFAAVSMYVLGGDVLRRLPIWILLLGLVYFSWKIDSQRQPQKNNTNA